MDSVLSWLLRCFQYAFAMETGNKICTGAGLFLDKAVFDAAVEKVLLGFVIFRIRQGTIDFRIVGCAAAGDVLTHEAE